MEAELAVLKQRGRMASLLLRSCQFGREEFKSASVWSVHGSLGGQQTDTSND